MDDLKIKKPLVIISGATGVGKSRLSCLLAEKISGEVISADSMQVYKGFDIGTAKITKEEMSGIPHHLIDILEPDCEFNIYLFRKLAMEAMDKIYANGHIPIIAGGTGFYIQALLYDVQFCDESNDRSYREYLEHEASEGRADKLYNMLKETDPDSADAIHPNNIKRVIRALEYYKETGEPISRHNEKQHHNRSPYNFAYFVLNRDRSVIYDRINRRVDEMVDAGLTEEVKMLLSQGISPESQAMQGIGYKEIVPYIEGKISLEEAVESIKTDTRHFAKRQNTWFKREKDCIWVNYEDFKGEDDMLEYMISLLNDKNIV